MGRPPSNGGPSFRFNSDEVAQMEAILQAHNVAIPDREVMVALAEKFSDSPDRKDKFVVQMKQVLSWFQNRRHALRSKTSKPLSPKLNVTPVNREDSGSARNVPQPASGPLHVPKTAPVYAHVPAPPPPVHPAGTGAAENTCMEFEAKSVRDGAWYDVQSFLAHRNLGSKDPEVQVRFTGFGSDEDEWVNVYKHVRPRSLPCEAAECVAVLPGDLILCFQEGKEQALYFDAHVLDAQRRRHDIRGCRCRFLVRYDHDQSEEIVPLRKVCRRPETDFRLQLLHAAKDSSSTEQPKSSIEVSSTSSSAATMRKPPNSIGLVHRANAPVPITKSSVESGSSNISTNASAATSSGGVGTNNIAPEQTCKDE